VNLLRKNHADSSKAGGYATSEEFRRLFTEDMTCLYLLSFVLTASHERAEQCFVTGLEDCVKDNSIFKEWARSWAKRAVVKNAIRIMAPRPNLAGGTLAGIHLEAGGRRQGTQDQHAAIASVLALGDFDRFVFVMSVLERYTEKECSVLLDCSRQDVREARVRAAQQIAEHTKHKASGQEDSSQPSTRSPEMVAQRRKDGPRLLSA
jgi:hypothetical protein